MERLKMMQGGKQDKWFITSLQSPLWSSAALHGFY